MMAGYKRRELRVCNNGYYDLAKEVIRQWKQDGMPRGDMEGVNLWADLLKSHQRMMRKGAHNGSTGTGICLP